MAKFKDIIDRVRTYNPDAVTDVIWKAYIFASKRHRGMSRLSGGPYLTHPLDVALILAELRMDVDAIAAGILHDTVEDTAADIKEIEETFGKSIALLVDGVTKLSKIRFTSTRERQAESFRKMMIAMAEDIRVIIIKLGDRLHNMRTLDSVPPDKQRRIAQETLEIYAPLANRLGIAWVKMELEDLALRYLDPEALFAVQAKLASNREERQQYIERVVSIVSQELDKAKIPYTIKSRLKHYFGIYQKMQSQQVGLDEVYDIIGFRIITETERDCYAILGVIHSLWMPIPGRFKDYIALPKSNMYQSLHTTVMGPGGERVEFQIRTEEMDRVAEGGIAAHWKYKEGKIDEHDYQKFSWLRHMLDWQREVGDPREFMETVRMDLFEEDVFVFTPKGEVRSFPRGSTTIDFAYAIHTDIGNHCAGAKVSGKWVPLKTELRNGDMVEIMTSNSKRPSRDWLKTVKTAKARAKIKAWLKAEDRERSRSLGKGLLEKELTRYGSDPRMLTTPEGAAGAQKVGFTSVDELFVSIGYGKNTAAQVARKILPKEVVEEADREGAAKFVKVAKRQAERIQPPGIRISGVEDGSLLARFARCCNPVPGDPIVGFITRGRGLSVHKADCPGLEYINFDPDRKIQLEWDSQRDEVYSVKIQVVAEDRVGLLAQVSSAISRCNANINQVHSNTVDKTATFEYEVTIRDLDQLNEIIRSLYSVGGVIKAERVAEYPGVKKGRHRDRLVH